MKEKNYLLAIVIVHGKSELQICKYIKSNLRLKIELEADKKGEKSIQINSILSYLSKTQFKNMKNFSECYTDAPIEKKKFIRDLKIFIIMDTDDCSEKAKESFMTKKMFEDHWLYDQIIPINNSPELESVLTKAGITFKKKGDKRKTEYIDIFPTSKDCSKSDFKQIEEFYLSLKK